MAVWFEVPGVPVGKARPRFARVGAGVRSYTPAKTANYEQVVAMMARAAMRSREPLQGALQATLTVGLPIPASWSQKKRNAAAMGEVWPTVKPDSDNVAKGILDACNGIVFKDDSQVVRLVVVKQYAIEPGVSVRIEAVE
ncbi:RusA family crossover junction endodeoxyribonuclease [Crenobacter cavernae]|uniref:RusA family crossover junction endodeoxyribonuclease n=1 Tax=Crenobacter cavernae TaxID=2290923 RepID=UPI001F0CCD9E|nr:RusA family crossover junction endodeoxyribonuclease [Crenobacter cavernae]